MKYKLEVNYIDPNSIMAMYYIELPITRKELEQAFLGAKTNQFLVMPLTEHKESTLIISTAQVRNIVLTEVK